MGKKLNVLLGATLFFSMFATTANAKFLSVDPVKFDPSNPSSFNRYAYSRNDPINRIDPDGRDSCSLRGCSDQMNIRTGQGRPIDQGVGGKALAVMAGAGLAVVAVGVASPAIAACTGACSTIGIGASAGAGFEGLNQAQAGEFNPVKLGASAVIGAAGGAGSLVGTKLTTQAAGAFGSAALTGSTVEMLSQGANGTVDGVGVVAAGAQAGVGAALGAGAGNLAGKGLSSVSGFGGAGNLSHGGAALGAALGEATSGTTIEIIDEKLNTP